VESKTASLTVIDESEYKEGTPVTEETYAAWWTGFIQEVRAKKAATTGCSAHAMLMFKEMSNYQASNTLSVAPPSTLNRKKTLKMKR
jgi:hypothetical protein